MVYNLVTLIKFIVEKGKVLNADEIKLMDMLKIKLLKFSIGLLMYK